jgi:glycyl-tRNA synthetase
MREFEQMELEWFCRSDQASFFFDFWCEQRKKFYYTIGLTPDKVRLRPHNTDELAHYAKACTDVEYHFPFGWKELEGIANRGSYDLEQHSTFAGKDLKVHDEETKTAYFPYVIESSVGVDRLFLTLLFDAYHEDVVENETRIVLRFSPLVAPIKAAFLPLTKKLEESMFKIYQSVKKETGFELAFDESGSIGKRYRRQDEIGTPYCFTYDYESQEDQKVTVRNRDTLMQERISIEHIADYLKNNIKK